VFVRTQPTAASVDDDFPLRGQAPDEVAQNQAGRHVQAGKRLVEKEDLRIVEQGRGDEDLLPHPLGIGADGRVPVPVQVEDAEKSPGFLEEPGLGQAAEPAHEEKIFQPAQMGVDLGLLGDIPQAAFIGQKVFADIPAAEENDSRGRLDQPGQDFDGRRFPGAVGAQIAQDLARPDGEADPVDGRKDVVFFRDLPKLEHRPSLPERSSLAFSSAKDMPIDDQAFFKGSRTETTPKK